MAVIDLDENRVRELVDDTRYRNPRALGCSF